MSKMERNDYVPWCLKRLNQVLSGYYKLKRNFFNTIYHSFYILVFLILKKIILKVDSSLNNLLFIRDGKVSTFTIILSHDVFIMTQTRWNYSDAPSFFMNACFFFALYKTVFNNFCFKNMSFNIDVFSVIYG